MAFNFYRRVRLQKIKNNNKKLVYAVVERRTAYVQLKIPLLYYKTCRHRSDRATPKLDSMPQLCIHAQFKKTMQGCCAIDMRYIAIPTQRALDKTEVIQHVQLPTATTYTCKISLNTSLFLEG